MQDALAKYLETDVSSVFFGDVFLEDVRRRSSLSFLWLFSQVGSVLFILFMDVVKSAIESFYPHNSYYLSVIIILIFDIIALLLCLLLRENIHK